MRLDGPPDRRARQATALQGLEHEEAERARTRFDRTHEAYFRQFYGVQIQDPALYHLVLDSTAIEFDACVEMIALAARSVAPAAGVSVNGPAA